MNSLVELKRNLQIWTSGKVEELRQWKGEKEQKVRQWIERGEVKKRSRCTVEIEHPRLLIKGEMYSSDEVPERPVITYYAFMGIPYAAPPLDHLRFQPPQPFTVPESGSEPMKIKAYSSNHPCLQYSSHSTEKKELIGSEDCLYLNIYTRKVYQKPKDTDIPPCLVPVLVHIHGGGFEKGSNSKEDIKPDYILRHNVVFVTINYRLGVFGFLNMGVEECQGNAGLKDQVKALEWIQKNITKFGGDPNNVTISGHEAGATCVNLHMISPLSKKLFHKAIVQAGGIYSPWGFQKKPKYVEQMCKKRYCTEANMTREAIVRVMQKDTTSKDLLNDIDLMARKYSERRSTRLVVSFGPSEEFREEGAFIPPKSIESLMREARNIPVIAGITKQEGYQYFHRRLTWCHLDFKNLLEDTDLFIKFLQENFHWSYDSARIRMDEIKQTYFRALVVDKYSYQALQDNLATFFTDIWFHRFFDNFKIGPESCTPLYVYQFDFFDPPTDNRPKLGLDYEKLETMGIRQKAAGHGDDMNYLYNPERMSNSLTRTPTMVDITEKMCRLWASFCQKGIPRTFGVSWAPHTEKAPCYLSINERFSMVSGRLGGGRWTDLKNILQSESVVSSAEPSPTFAPLTAIESEDISSSQRAFKYSALK